MHRVSFSVFDVEFDRFISNKKARFDVSLHSRVLVMCSEAVAVITQGLRSGLLRP